MNIKEMIVKLHEMQIPRKWYFVGTQGNNDNKYCLEYIDGKWQVYYCERGKKYKLSIFNEESEACTELLERMIQKKSRLSNL